MTSGNDLGMKKIIIYGLAVLCVYIAIFSNFRGEVRIIFLVSSALIVLPYSWLILRGEKAGDVEGRLPPHPTTPISDIGGFGEYKLEGLPEADLPLMGPSKSTPSFYSSYLISRQWIHPDFHRMRKIWENQRKEAREKEDKS